MNYIKIYDSIISNAKKQDRVKGSSIYYENHHIVPKCLGGGDTTSNRVLLTAKEHYLCHKLLYKAYPHDRKLAYAFTSMFRGLEKRGYKPSSRAFDEYKNLIADLKRGVKKSDESIQKRTQTRKANGSYKRTKQSVQKGIETRRLKDSYKYPKTVEHRQRLSKAHIGYTYTKVICPVCSKQIAINTASRWHFDNCKFKLINC